MTDACNSLLQKNIALIFTISRIYLTLDWKKFAASWTPTSLTSISVKAAKRLRPESSGNSPAAALRNTSKNYIPTSKQLVKLIMQDGTRQICKPRNNVPL